jgi:hypothetical protein
LTAAVLGLAAATSVTGCAIGFRGPAPDVSDKTAYLQGDVLSNRTETGEYWFKYGTSTSYGEETAHDSVNYVAGARQGVFASLSGLDHHTTYHYALCADDQEPGVGAFCSGDQTFTTVGDHVRGQVAVLAGGGVITSFNDVETGFNGEDPKGSVTLSNVAGQNPVTCLNITGDNRFTVAIAQFGGALYSYIFMNVPSGSGTAASWTAGTTPPTTCPADPDPSATLFPAFALEGFEVSDQP